MQDEAGEVDLRDEEGEIRPEFLHAVAAALDTGEAAKLRDLALPLHEADLADLIELLRPEQRTMLIATLKTPRAVKANSEASARLKAISGAIPVNLMSTPTRYSPK